MTPTPKRKNRDVVWMAKWNSTGYLCPPSCHRDKNVVREWIKSATTPGYSTFTIVRVGELPVSKHTPRKGRK